MWIGTFIGSVLLMFVFSALAKREAMIERPFFSGWLPVIPNYGKRIDFTDRGWVYRNLMIGFQVLAVAAMLGWFLNM